jgi:pyruvate,orthophosphate dikinase
VIGGTTLLEGDFVSPDGNTGAVHAGRLALLTEKPERALEIIAGWRHAHSSKRQRKLSK